MSRRAIALLAAAVLAAAAGESGYPDPAPDERAILGVHMTPPSPLTQLANQTAPDLGVEVRSIYADTAAERMGIRPGDLIVSVNGSEVRLMNDVRDEVRLAGVGGAVEVVVLREGQRHTLAERVAAWPADVPWHALDDAEERRYRAWQDQRWATIAAVAGGFAQRIAALERQPWATAGRRELLPSAQRERLRRLPAFRLRVRAQHRAGGVIAPASPGHDVSALLGHPTPTIH